MPARAATDPLRFALVAVAYVATAKAGLALATFESTVTAVWAPTGIALAAIVLWGPRMWPAVAVGALLANAGTGIAAPAVALIAAGNTLEALIGARLLALVDFRPTLARMRDVIALAVLAGMVSTLVSATIGVAAIRLEGALGAADVPRAWLTWWLGDLGGDLLVAPLLLVLASLPPGARVPHGRRGEALALALAGLATSAIAFSYPAGLVFLTFPVFGWAALRFRQLGAAAASCLIATVGIVLTAHDLGPFHAGAPDDALLLAQLFASVACSAALALGVVTGERERALDELRRSRDELERDVRERTQALTGAHARIAATHELAPVGSWDWDIATDTLTWSDELYAIFGLDREHHEPSYGDYLGRVHPDDREDVLATIQHARASGGAFTFEERIMRPDGTLRTLASGGQILRDDDGRPVRMLGICQDITESQRAELALRASQERARTIVDAASHAFISSDEHDVITDWNPAAERLFGWTRHEALGRTIAETIVPPRDREKHRRGLARFVETGTTSVLGRRQQFVALRRDGRTLIVELEVSVVAAQDGYSFNAFVQDVSERSRAERRLLTENAVGRMLLESTTLAEARPRLLEEVCRGLGWSYGAWWERDPRHDALMRVESWRAPDGGGFAQDPAAGPATSALGVGLPGRTWLAGEPLVIRDRGGARRTYERLAQIGADGLCGAVALPIVNRGEIVGVIELVNAAPLVVGGDVAAVMERLAGRIAGYVERERFEGQLQHRADHDALTDLFNHRRFVEELGRELAAAQRYETGGAVLVLDLDNLKQVNDTLGHDAGNELIARVASLIRERLRKTDVAARIGGDEFAAVLPRADVGQARQIAEELLDAIRRQAVVDTPRGSCGTSASIGIAIFGHGSDPRSGDELLDEADTAMYAAKDAGRDRVHVHDPASGPAGGGGWAERIRGALAGGEFTLHAQPIVALQRSGNARHELLLRMVGAGGDIIAPAMFLGVAERLELVQELDRWVIGEAIGLLAERQRAGHAEIFNVNISARSVNDPELPGMIERELARAGADPRRLRFEVTARAAVADVERARRFARSLGEIGCGFVLDDFGAGFASFYNLKHLPFDELKIDGEFVENLAASPVNQLVVRSIIEIARGLGKHTVAECVGDDATLELLRELGVDYAQGFHLGRPRPVAELGAPAGAGPLG